MQTFTHPIFGEIRVTEKEGKVWCVWEDIKRTLHCSENPLVALGGIFLEGQQCVNLSFLITYVKESGAKAPGDFLQWLEFTVIHSVLKEIESKHIWRRFIVTGTLEEVRELMEILRDKQLCHEEIALLLSTMRLREEK